MWEHCWASAASHGGRPGRTALRAARWKWFWVAEVKQVPGRVEASVGGREGTRGRERAGRIAMQNEREEEAEGWLRISDECERRGRWEEEREPESTNGQPRRWRTKEKRTKDERWTKKWTMKTMRRKIESGKDKGSRTTWGEWELKEDEDTDVWGGEGQRANAEKKVMWRKSKRGNWEIKRVRWRNVNIWENCS